MQRQHTEILFEQAVKDTHPVFGAYIIYLQALELRLLRLFQAALDHLQYAMKWLETWRNRDDETDLSQRVFPTAFLL